MKYKCTESLSFESYFLQNSIKLVFCLILVVFSLFSNENKIKYQVLQQKKGQRNTVENTAGQ